MGPRKAFSNKVYFTCQDELSLNIIFEIFFVIFRHHIERILPKNWFNFSRQPELNISNHSSVSYLVDVMHNSGKHKVKSCTWCLSTIHLSAVKNESVFLPKSAIPGKVDFTTPDKC